MGLVAFGVVFSVLFNFGATEIPPCTAVNITTICSLNNKDGLEGPPKPWPVNIILRVLLGSLIEVDEQRNSLKVLILLGQSWNDTRITVNSNSGLHTLHLDVLNHIWYNEPFFYPTVKIERSNRIVAEKSSHL